jgi:hypothetical protein
MDKTMLFNYRMRILCTFHIVVEFEIVLYKSLNGWGGGGPEKSKFSLSRS